jgi:hypothetical protein
VLLRTPTSEDRFFLPAIKHALDLTTTKLKIRLCGQELYQHKQKYQKQLPQVLNPRGSLMS